MVIYKCDKCGKECDGIEKYKFRRQLRKIDWDSVIKAMKQTSKMEADK